MSEVAVTIDLVARAEKALSQIDSFGRKASSQIDKVSGAFGLLQVAAIAAGAAFVANKIVDGLTSCIDEAREAETAFFKLKGVLKATGEDTDRNVDTFRRYATEIARTSKYDDDLILKQFALAKQFKTTNREAVDLVKAATNLSAITGDDLSTSTELLGRTLDGTAGRLREMIPAVRHLTAEQLVNAGAIKLVAGLYAGAAENELNTFDGAVAKLGTSFGDLKKSIGKLFVDNDVVIKFIGGIADGFKNLEQIVADNKTQLRDLVTNGIQFMIQGTVLLAGSLKLIQETFEILLRDVKDYLRRLGAIPEYLKNIATFNSDANKKLEASLDASFAKDDSRGAARLRYYDKFIAAAGDLSQIIDKASKSEDKLATATKKVKEGFDAANGPARALAETIEEKLNKLKKFMDRLDQIRNAPTNGFFDEKTLLGAGAAFGEAAREKMAFGLGVISQVLSGKQGAVKLMSGAAEALGKAFLGVPGIGSLFEQLAMGPDHVKAMVKEFFTAIPDIITAVVEAVPAIIDALAEKLSDPAFVERFAVAMASATPKIAEGLVKALVNGSVRIISSWVQGAGQFVGKILDGAAQFVAKLIEGIEKGLGEIFAKLDPGSGNFLGINTGGGGGGGAGGAVIGGTIGNVIGGGAIGGTVGAVVGGLFKGEQDARPMTISIPVVIDRKQIAEIMVDLDKYGHRTRS